MIVVVVGVVGTCWQRTRMRFLGTRLACLVVLYAWHNPIAGTLVGQFAVTSIRGTTFEGCGENGDQTASGITFRSGVEGVGDARYRRYDAGRH